MKQFDAIIIGAGQAGVPLAKKLANEGLHTAIIERRYVGGTCINDGCTPTKSMVACARMAYLAKHSKKLGIKIDDYEVDFKKIIQHKNKIVKQFRNGSEKGLRSTENVELIFGEASFTGHKQLKVVDKNKTEQTLTAEKIFINTGARPAVPTIKGLDKIDFLDSTTIMELKKIPEHLIIIGGGYIGVEFGQMFKRFGSKVTILDHSQRFLSREDEDVADCIFKILSDEKIDIFTNTTINKITSTKNHVTVEAVINGKDKKIKGTHVLVGAGRTPNTGALQPQQTGVELNERGYIKVNDKLETIVEGIYALGDVKGAPEFTHISYNDYLIVYHNLFKNGNETITNRFVPYCMFIDPQLGRIGITEQEAIKKGLHFKVATMPMNYVARAIETSETKGLMKAIVDADTKKILGAAILGEQGGEVMSMIEIAMMGNLTYNNLRNATFAHPLYSEALNNLFMSLEE